MQQSTEVIYEAIDARILELVANTQYHCKYVILLGAILINSYYDMGSYNCPRRFEVIDLMTNTRRDMLKEGIMA